jgi:glutamate carboxypeptidase
MIATLRDWVNHDSPTFNKQALDELGQRLAQTFEQTGARKVVCPQPKQGDHYSLTWSYPEAQGQILIVGHFDTVWPDGEAARRPFAVKDGVATGPGVSDMKAGLVVALFAMQAIQTLNLQPTKNVVLILNSDEEVGSITSRALVEAEARQSSACLVVEPARDGKVITRRKGLGRFELTITGRAAHAGVEPQKGLSAIEELAYQILGLHAMTDYEIGTTVNVGVVDGGERSNVVAAEARAQIDLRVATRAEGERVVKAIQNLPPKLPGISLNTSGGLTRPPFEETPAGLALFAKAQAIAAELGFELGKTDTGGGSDGNFTAALNIPTLDGLGGVGGGSHALSEHTLVEHLPQRAALLAKLILAL